MEGFLPWATLGELFTSTIVSTRAATRSLHGVALADVVVTFVVRTPDSPSVLVPTRRAVIHGVLGFILNTKGRIFQFAILYLLRGLTKGLMALAVPLQEPFTQAELGQVLQVSRIAGLPEIANDLCLEYCLQICQLVTPHWHDYDWTGLADLRARGTRLLAPLEQLSGQTMDETSVTNSSPLKVLLAQLDASNHRSIQGESYAPACKSLIEILDRTDPASVSHTDLYNLLDAFWEEADRRQFCKSVAINIPPLLFHPTCIRACVLQHCNDSGIASNVSLQSLLSKAMDQLQRLSDGRSYVLAVLAVALRRAALSDTKILNILPYDDYTVRFLNVVPSTKIEFLFEIAAAEELQQYRSHRTYEAYYGQREWHAYASVIDLIQRFPVQQLGVAKRVLNQLLEPWKEQRAGIPVISKWKNVLQLQAMLLLAEFTISESEVDSYLEAFRHALILEAWPRYRFLLEWIIARLYHKFPGKTAGLLDDLSNLDDNSSTHIASLMKLAVLIAPHETEDFSTKFMTQLVPFSASPKVHIRHESNYAIPIIIDLALSKGWTSITENKAFIALNAFIRRLDKFQSVPWTIRTLKLDAVKDFHLVNIFQGQYLTIESPEKIRVTYEDFLALQHADKISGLVAPPSRISLGTRLEPAPPVPSPLTSPPHKSVDSHSNPTPSFFQTKSSFDPLSLLAASGPPSTQSHRPASIILVASLIDNPTNLGGLSRISESFGIEALYIDDVRKIAHKDFKATSVTSEKHFPIRELKVEGVPGFLNSVKGEGWQVVGIEQTDRSGVLGTEDGIDIGTLPRKCVLVLGSEKGGISAEVLAVVDRCVEIRTVGVTRSLSKSIQLFEFEVVC
jgi:tRNA guanosine-2'-O-methyltransferase